MPATRTQARESRRQRLQELDALIDLDADMTIGSAHRCRANSAPVSERQWLRTGRVVDLDGIEYNPSTGQPRKIGLRPA